MSSKIFNTTEVGNACFVTVVSARLVEAEPLPSLRSKAHKVIREILPYIRAQFAFKLGHANFPTGINCLHTTLY